MKLYTYLAAASTLALIPAALQAENTDRQGAETPDSDKIVVTANRTSRDIAQVGASVTVIAEEEIVIRQSSEVVDLLRTVPGVTFNRNGGIGTNTGVSIRGAQTVQTVVLVDGIKLNDPSSIGGGFDFGPLLTGNIARVEVVRGSQSVLYGSQAIGGVVNLLTREPTEDLGVFARAEYGSRDTAELVGNISGKFGPVSASFGGTYFTTDGISAFNETRGGTEADGFESIGVNGKVDVALSDNISLDLRAFYADGETEIDGFAPPTFAFGDTNEVSFREDFVGYAGINAAFLDGAFRNRLGFGYTDIQRRNFNNDTDFETFVGSGENQRFEYQGVLDATDQVQIVFGAEREESEFTSSSFGAPPTTADASINSLYAEVNVAPVEGLSLTGGLRHDDTDFGNATVFAASGAFSPNDGKTVIRASYGEGFKAPSLFQLFSNFGNPDLTAEESESWDAGVTQSFLDGRAQVSVTYFERDGTNEINFVGCDATIPICNDPGNPRPFGTYVNVDSVSADGWEFSVALEPIDGFDIAMNYSIIDAFDDTTGNRAARRAKETASLVADYQSDSGFGIGATILIVGDSFNDTFNTTRIDGYAIGEVRASYAVSENLEVFGRIENVTNEDYETITDFGTPGRGFFGGVRYRM